MTWISAGLGLGSADPPAPTPLPPGPRGQRENRVATVSVWLGTVGRACPLGTADQPPCPRPPTSATREKGLPVVRLDLYREAGNLGFSCKRESLAWFAQTHECVNEAPGLWVSPELWPRSCGPSSRRPNKSLDQNKNNSETQNSEH